MGGKKGGENTKKASGNAKKAEAAAQKQAAADVQAAATQDKEWDKGSKSNAKKEAEAEKKAADARRKAENAALLAEEEKSQRTTPKNANAKSAGKKTNNKGANLDLSQLDSPDTPTTETSAVTLNATGIDNALDALSLTSPTSNLAPIDRNAGRRVGGAFEAYKERNIARVKEENPGLRKQQRDNLLWKEFQRSEENPLNAAGAVKYDAGKEEVREAMESVREGIERRLGEE